MDIDLLAGVLPISKAASSLAALIKRAARSGGPIIVSQKGYPSAVLLSVESYVALAHAAERAAGHRVAGEALPFTPPWQTNGEALDAALDELEG